MNPPRKALRPTFGLRTSGVEKLKLGRQFVARIALTRVMAVMHVAWSRDDALATDLVPVNPFPTNTGDLSRTSEVLLRVFSGKKFCSSLN